MVLELVIDGARLKVDDHGAAVVVDEEGRSAVVTMSSLMRFVAAYVAATEDDE